MTEIQLIEDLFNKARYLEAHNLAEEFIEENDSNIRIKQLLALCLSKSGAAREAKDFLEPVYQQQKSDPETAGILGGIYKELFKQQQDTAYAMSSRDIYFQNFQETNNYYTGINAATMSVIAGDARKGREIAQGIIDTLKQKENDLWENATLGEAFLLLKDTPKAKEYYSKAREMAGIDWGKVNSIYAQLWLLNHYMTIPSEVSDIFSPPNIVVFIGHMIDHPDRKSPRFPSEIEGQVKEHIQDKLQSLNAQIGYSSLACGSDILFVESLLERNAEANIYLPFDKDDFIETSVSFAGSDWERRFKDILNNKDVKFTTEEPYLGDEVLFTFLGQVLYGSAILRSSTFNTKPSLITVSSAHDLQKKEGGTRAMIDEWPPSYPKVNIDVDSFYQPVISTESEQDQELVDDKRIKRRLLYLMSAEISGLAQVDEEKAPDLVMKVWGKIADSLKELLIEPLSMQVWGEQFVSVFSSMRALVDFAGKMTDFMDDFDWEGSGMPDVNLKLGLHAGPVYLGINPITQRKVPYGIHYSKVKELQRVTLPGLVYASEQFAAILALKSQDYNIDHVGLMKLSDQLGSTEIYRISRKRIV